MSKHLNSIAKVAIGFVLGATIIGGIATASGSFSTTSIICADNRTGALRAVNGTCPATSTQFRVTSTNATSGIISSPILSSIASAGSLKTIVAKVSPSVVTVDVTVGSGGDSGSGSIIKSDGSTSYILTNNHVIEAAVLSGSISVELNSGETYKATIVGRDVNYDLAVLKISQGNLPVIDLGDSSGLSIGDQVIAFGSPLGLQGTVTSGIVSSLNRPVTTQGSATAVNSYVDAIQTDAAINPGNSGGPLTDIAGRIVGVNSAIASTSSGAGNIGLGFAIPINEAQRVYNEIITSPTHQSTRPLLGVYFDNNYQGKGGLVQKLVEGEGAAKAGIPVGAIITAIDGQRVSDQVAAIVKIRSYAPGATVKVTVTMPNNGGTKTFSVTLGSSTN